MHLEEGLKDSLFSDIDVDLFNCYLNNKYKKNHPIWNMIEDAYFKGFWPCGWEGKYPEGKLVVFKLLKEFCMLNFYDCDKNLSENDFNEVEKN